MIITVTLNPAIDKLLLCPKIEIGVFNKIGRPTIMPGGKAVNIAAMLNRLGHDTLALGLIGGFGGEYIEETLEAQQISVGFTHIREDTRTNSILIESDGKTTHLAEAGPIVTPEEVEDFLSAYNRSLSGGDVVIIAGSLPPGVPTDIYFKMIETAKNRGLKTVLNARGGAFAGGAQAGPEIAKPDVRLEPEVLGINNSTLTGRLELAGNLFSLGTQIVIIAVGGTNHEIYTQTQAYEVSSPGHPPGSTVIAGDAFLAGFIDAQRRGRPIDEACIWAMAAELAAGQDPEKRLATLEEVQGFIDMVALKVIE